MAEKRKGFVFMLLASVCWSLGGLCIRFIPWNPMCIVGLRALFAAVVFAAFRKSLKISFTRGNVLAALCLSAVTILFVFANKLTSAAAAICLQFTAPVFIIIIELVLYGKKPCLSETVAVAVTILGMLLFFLGDLNGGAALGNLLAIASGLAFAGVFVSNRRPDVNTDHSLFLGFIINALIGLPFLTLGFSSVPSAWLAAVVLGVVQVGLAYVFFSIGIRKTPALTACLITALEPVLNPVWVALVTRETPGLFQIAGGSVIILTVVVFNVWSEKFTKNT